MKAISVLLISTVLSAVLFSCQKEVDGTTPNSPQADSSFLDKVIALDTTLPVGADTTEKMTLTYDNSKRLSRVSQLFEPGFVSSQTIDFLYSGNDSLAYKTITHDLYTGLWDYTDTAFFTYSNGLVAKDSTITLDNDNGSRSALVFQYTISGTTVSRSKRYYDYIGGVYVLLMTENSSLNVVFTGGNLVTQTLLTGDNTFESVQATYDNKPNPVAKAFKIKYPEADSPDFLSWWFQKNNPAQVVFKEVGSPPDADTYTYTYRSDGYPTKFIYGRTSGGQLSNKVLFFYKTL